MSPDRHFEGARLLGANLTGKERREDAGNILGDVLRGIMQTMKIPNGIRFRKEIVAILSFLLVILLFPVRLAMGVRTSLSW